MKRFGVVGVALASIGGVTGFVTVANGARPEASLTDASAQAPGVFVSVSPLRVLDTRPAPYGPIGVATASKLGPDSSMDLALAGDGRAVPDSATSVLLNVTIDGDATLQSFLTVWPTGEPRPNASANNALPTLIASNSILAKLGSNGRISIYNQAGTVNVVVDLVGYVVPLSTADGNDTGGDLNTGSGAPAANVGENGDLYLDTTNKVLYGPKTNGAYASPGISLASDPDGAASAYSEDPATLNLTALQATPIAFATAGPSEGSVSQTNTTTFTVSEDGLYSVDYRIELTGAPIGTLSVTVNGLEQGPALALTGSVLNYGDNVLVDAEAGDTIRVEYTPTLLGLGVGVTSSSIVITQSATS